MNMCVSADMNLAEQLNKNMFFFPFSDFRCRANYLPGSPELKQPV